MPKGVKSKDGVKLESAFLDLAGDAVADFILTRLVSPRNRLIKLAQDFVLKDLVLNKKLRRTTLNSLNPHHLQHLVVLRLNRTQT